MGDIEIKYAKDGQTAVGVILEDKRRTEIELSFNYGQDDTDGGIARCKEKNRSGYDIFYIGVDEGEEGCYSCAILNISQMEALEKVIHSMVASIKGE